MICFIRASDIISSTNADGTSMLADRGRIRKRVGTRPKPVVRVGDTSEEHAHGLIGDITGARYRSEEMEKGRTTSREEDLNLLDAQQFLDIVRYSGKGEDSAQRAKKYLKDFKEFVYSDERNLNSDIDHMKARSYGESVYSKNNGSLLKVFRSSQDTLFSKRFRIAYFSTIHGIAAGDASEKHPNPSTENPNNTLYQKSTEVLSGAASLIKQLQKSCSRLDNQRVLFTTNTACEEGVYRTKRVFDIGRQIGERKLESVLTSVDKPQLDTEMSEISHLLYDKCTRLPEDLTWEWAARKQERAVMRIVDTLPLE